EVCFVDGMESDRCQLIQDHRYDYELPAEPWVPIHGAAQLEGVSYLALGLALLAVTAAMGGRWYVRAGTAALGA
ncbi:hypothetical protein PU560_00055, partial [Georgenia sp. 10Sc9-8]|nr:hypothetical protein [Georgenia halotolerans]